jgi:hypothetical protein
MDVVSLGGIDAHADADRDESDGDGVVVVCLGRPEFLLDDRSEDDQNVIRICIVAVVDVRNRVVGLATVGRIDHLPWGADASVVGLDPLEGDLSIVHELPLEHVCRRTSIRDGVSGGRILPSMRCHSLSYRSRHEILEDGVSDGHTFVFGRRRNDVLCRNQRSLSLRRNRLFQRRNRSSWSGSRQYLEWSGLRLRSKC